MSDTIALLIDAYLDDTLDEAQARRLLQHLRESPAACEHLRALIAVDHGLRGLAGSTIMGAEARLAVLARIRSQHGDKDFRKAFEQRIAKVSPKPKSKKRWVSRIRPKKYWSNFIAAASLLLLVATAVVWFQQTKEAPLSAGAIAVVESAMGWVSIERNYEAETIHNNQAVMSGDRLVTGAHAEAIIRFVDGTRMKLNGHTALRVPANDGARAGLEHGSVLATVTPQSQQAHPILSTSQNVIRVFGTAFHLSTDGDLTELKVTEGVVGLTTREHREWQVHAGESLRVIRGESERTFPLSLRRNKSDAWYNGNARSLSGLSSFSSLPSQLKVSQWGGRLDRSWRASNKFDVHHDGSRWWLVDPAGHPLLLTGISHVCAKAKNPTLINKFITYENWASATLDLLLVNDFNVIGSSSDHVTLSQEANRRKLNAGHVLSFNVAESFSIKYCASNKKLSSVKSEIQMLAPLMTGFTKHLLAWESELKDLSTQSAIGIITDSYVSPEFTWKSLREITLADKDVGSVINRWLLEHQRTWDSATKDDLASFRRSCLLAYRDMVYHMVRRVAPKSLLFGQTLGRNPGNVDVIEILGAAVDVVPIHFIGHWAEDSSDFSRVSQIYKRPLFISSFYAKGADSGLANIEGSGLEVISQADRARFYQHMTLQMLQSQVVVGWQWHRYEDIGDGSHAPDGNYYISNKGIVDAKFNPYSALLTGMAEINRARYALCDYFDANSVR